MTDISIDVGSALPFLEDKILALFGKDFESRDAANLLTRQTRLAVRDASTVQIVGMDKPVAISDIYQPTRLRKQWRDTIMTFRELVDEGRSSVIFGRPGAGKTVLLHYMFMRLSAVAGVVPVLFTLRRSGAAEDLTRFVKHLAADRVKLKAKSRVVLLVDGYDEVSADTRKGVSEILRDYQSYELGPFFLTCRSFYPIDDAGAEHFEIAPFSTRDSEGFVDSFARAYGANIDPKVLISELRNRGFDDFVSHPLMLALVCILKAGPMPMLPRSTIGLLRRAVDTLTFRWDESKNISRDTKLPIDGEDRVRCMMRVAFVMKKYEDSSAVVEHVVSDYLKLLQRADVSAPRLLTEIAQWYGMLVPAPGDVWMFAHRTIHDFLAARYWVESGMYAPSRVNVWNVRAAYAACLLPDATSSIVRALQSTDDLAPLVECLYNNARFAVDDVAAAVISHFIKFRGYTLGDIGGVIDASVMGEFFPLASDEFLCALMSEGLKHSASPAHKLMFWYSFAEFLRRQSNLPETLRVRALREYGNKRIVNLRRGDVSDKLVVAEVLQQRGA